MCLGRTQTLHNIELSSAADQDRQSRFRTGQHSQFLTVVQGDCSNDLLSSHLFARPIPDFSYISLNGSVVEDMDMPVLRILHFL
jgi:hypothetical protein